MTLSRAVNTADVELRGPDCSNQGLALYSWTGLARRYSHPEPHMQSQKQRHARNLPSAVQWPGKRRSLLHIMVSALLLKIFVVYEQVFSSPYALVKTADKETGITVSPEFHCIPL